MGRIIIVSMSNVDAHVLAALKQGLEETFNQQVEVRVKISSLDHAYDSSRIQYISPRLLSRLSRMKENRGDKIVGLVDVDLYSPGFDFVFGEADVAAGIATVSLYRLQQEYCAQPSDSNVLEERAIKEVVHELGHLCSLRHCPNPECVMHFSTSLGNVDQKTKMFCTKCMHRLRYKH